MKVENLQMRTLASLISEGKKVAFISGNRNVNSKNITSKKESFGRFECNIVPLMYVNGTKAVEDGCNLVDASTEQIVDANKVSSYIAIVDGQHRYTAAMEKGISPEFLILFEDYTGANTKDLLATANIDSFAWNSSNYIDGAVLFNPENELAKFAKELSDLKYPITNIGKILCFASGKLGKKQFADIMAGKNIEVKGLDMERAKNFLDAARSKFEDDFISSRYLIDAAISLQGKKGENALFDAIRNLSEKVVYRILDAKSDKKGAILENALKALLDA